jgi:O-acetyl-ADP-ribose deacetylase (regulator of RNase III)
VDSTARLQVGRVGIELKVGDITLEDTEAIANAANSRLAGGGGVDGAIHRAGGPSIMEECRKIGSCPTGSAVITGGGRLKAKFVIHAVGPVYCGKPRDAELLGSAYTKCLEIARDRGIGSISFPSISTGAYGYPVEEASRVALKAVADFAKKNDTPTLTRFVLYNSSDFEVYRESLEEIAGA